MTHLSTAAAASPASLRILTAVASIAVASFAPSSVRALDEQKGEEKLIKTCEERLCTMLLRKDPKGDDLKCELTKTWARSTIKDADSHTLKWGYGDARCSVHLHIPRATIVAAMTSPEYTFEVAPHTADCVVEENGEPQEVKATLTPKIVFKNGKAEKVWVNLKSIKGPTSIKTSLWLAATLTDKVGLFHRQMIKSINKFIDKHCAKTYPNALQASAVPKSTQREVASKPAAPRPAPKKNGG
jgi:hypothetical protein